MKAVYKRELKAYMNNVYGYLFMAVLLCACGVMVFLQNLLVMSPHVEYALIQVTYVFLVMIPVLCMRSMAEDKRNKTDMFYLSLPLSTGKVVLGKYFALLTVYVIPCLVVCLYPLLLGFFGEVNYLSAYISIAYFILLGAGLLAVGQFMSSLTENLVVAAVLGVVAMAVLCFMPLVSGILPTAPIASFIGLVVLALLVALVAFVMTRNLTVATVTGAVLIIPLSVLYIILGNKFAGVLNALLEYLSPFLHFEYVAGNGIMDIGSLILLLSYPVFFLFLTVQSADKKRWA